MCLCLLSALWGCAACSASPLLGVRASALLCLSGELTPLFLCSVFSSTFLCSGVCVTGTNELLLFLLINDCILYTFHLFTSELPV